VLAGRGDHILFQETRPEQPRGIIAEFAAGKRRSTVTPFAIPAGKIARFETAIDRNGWPGIFRERGEHVGRGDDRPVVGAGNVERQRGRGRMP
jgi:hypothetical protein